MANEISARATISLRIGNVERSLDTGTFRCDADESVAEGPKTLLLTTTKASLSAGSMTNPNWLWIQNTHATVTALISLDNDATWPISIPPNGGHMQIPLASGITIAHLMAKSVTNPGSIDYAFLP
jgi:hypothetical protein